MIDKRGMSQGIEEAVIIFPLSLGRKGHSLSVNIVPVLL